MPAPLRALTEDYQQRLQRGGGVSLVEVAEARRSGATAADRQQGLLYEANRLREHIPQSSLLLPLDSTGRMMSSLEFAGQMQRWREAGEHLCFVIGGPDGLHPDLLRMGSATLSLGPMTFPHLLVRVLLLEQLYRAYTLIQGIPYHR